MRDKIVFILGWKTLRKNMDHLYLLTYLLFLVFIPGFLYGIFWTYRILLQRFLCQITRDDFFKFSVSENVFTHRLYSLGWQVFGLFVFGFGLFVCLFWYPFATNKKIGNKLSYKNVSHSLSSMEQYSVKF